MQACFINDMEIREFNDYIELSGLEHFDISKIFDCGQCFRFDPDPKGGISGVAMGRFYRFEQNAPDSVKIFNTTKDDFETRLKYYLSLDCDYGMMNDDIIHRFGEDETIKKAVKTGDGIRLLRQEPFEVLISFIISQNNNIPRIKKLVYVLSVKCGEQISDTQYAFPTPEAIYSLGEAGLYELKTGFRAKYIFDAVKRVLEGDTDLEALSKLDTETLLTELMKIKGVGLKVASCAALFGYNRTDSFPVDVWIKKVIDKYYPDGLDLDSLGEYRGLGQQYLFYFERYNNA